MTPKGHFEINWPFEQSIYLTERSNQFLKYIGTIEIETEKIIGFERLAEKVSNFKPYPSFR